MTYTIMFQCLCGRQQTFRRQNVCLQLMNDRSAKTQERGDTETTTKVKLQGIFNCKLPSNSTKLLL